MNIVPKVIHHDQLLTHYPYELGSSLKLSQEAIRQRLLNLGDQGLADVLEDLSDTPIGRFLIVNQGLNGYWWDQIARYPLRPRPKQNPLETFIFEQAPRCLAIQESFVTLQKIIQPLLRDGLSIASIPSGLMADILTLNYDHINNISLTAIDLDYESLAMAHEIVNHHHLSQWITLIQEDIWELTFKNRFNLVVSTGFTPYLHMTSDLSRFLGIVKESLCKGGILLMPFWHDSPKENEHRAMEDRIFKDVLQLRWHNEYALDQMAQHLQEAGFTSVEYVLDSQQLYPMAIAQV